MFDLLGGLFERNSECFLVLLVGTTDELENLLIRADTHGFESDNDRDLVFERVVLEIKSLRFGGDICFHDSVVGGTGISLAKQVYESRRETHDVTSADTESFF